MKKEVNGKMFFIAIRWQEFFQKCIWFFPWGTSRDLVLINIFTLHPFIGPFCLFLGFNGRFPTAFLTMRKNKFLSAILLFNFLYRRYFFLISEKRKSVASNVLGDGSSESRNFNCIKQPMSWYLTIYLFWKHRVTG